MVNIKINTYIDMHGQQNIIISTFTFNKLRHHCPYNAALLWIGGIKNLKHMRNLICELSKEIRTPNTTRSRRPRGLRRRSAAARLLRLWVRIPSGHGCLLWVLCVLSSRGLCDELIACRRGVLQNVKCRCVWPTNLVNEEALAHRGLLRRKQKYYTTDRECFFYLTMPSAAKIITSGAKIILYLIESRGFCATLNNAT